jgi:hypothetical protein
VRWYHYLGYFMGGAFLVNAIPHFVSGVMGHPFQSPFASPPGEGLSPAWVNVLWGSANLVPICSWHGSGTSGSVAGVMFWLRESAAWRLR